MSRKNEKSIESGSEQEKLRPHEQPIIITGGSVTVGFDDPEVEHYVPDNRDNPTLYTGRRLIITKVEVYVPGSPLRTFQIPNGRCTVTMFGKRSSKPQEDEITFDSQTTAKTILIRPNNSEYMKQDNESSKFKTHRSDEHKVQRLRIDFPTGGPRPIVVVIPPNGECDIRIYDTHT
jgi:hypothetical protein